MLALLMAAALSLDGRCNYSVALGPALVGETRALCNHVEVRDSGPDAVIEFTHQSTTARIRFMGTLDGHRMTVRSLATVALGERAAHGSCNIFYKEERVSAVSCVAQAGARSFVANFIVPQI
jgi:hypothetical protein